MTTLAVAVFWLGGQSTPSLPDVLAKVRKAVNLPALEKQAAGMVLQGSALAMGEKGSFTFAFSPDGKSRQRLYLKSFGEIPQTFGFDGKEYWYSDWTGATTSVDPLGGAERVLSYDLRTHSWLNPKRGYRIEVEPTQSSDVNLRVTSANGFVTGTVRVDGRSWLPQSLTIKSATGNQTDTFVDYRSKRGLMVPHTITTARGAQIDTLTVESVSPLAPEGPDPFSKPVWKSADTRFDASRPSAVASRLGPGGHILVHPRVNGKDIGWFILDSGAGVTTIDPKLADDLGLPKAGRMALSGIGGVVMGGLRKAGEISLGKATVRGLWLTELDLSSLGDAFGVKVAGVMGFDMFRRSIVEVDLVAPTVQIYDPEAYGLPGGSWEKIELVSRTPAVTATFENGKSGIFRLDTGASTAVIFNHPAVKKHRLLEGRTLRPAGIGGVGGGSPAQEGTISSFTLGGKTFANPSVVFSTGETGLLADPYLAGTIGHPFMRPFRMVFDYGRSRIAFIPK